jgi:hypothetical protein
LILGVAREYPGVKPLSPLQLYFAEVSGKIGYRIQPGARGIHQARAGRPVPSGPGAVAHGAPTLFDVDAGFRQNFLYLGGR